MNVPFYGHTRQYHSIKGEIDANISKSWRAASTSWGPMLKQFETEFAAYTGKKYAIGVGNGTDAIWLAFMALGLEAGRRDHHPRQHLLRHRRGDLDRRRARRCSSTATRRPAASTRKAIEAAITPEDQGHHPRAPLRPVRRHAGDPQDRRRAQAVRDRGQRPGHRRPRRRLPDRRALATRSPRASSSRRTSAPSATAARVVHEQRRRSTHRVRKLRNHGSDKRDHHSFGFNSRLDDLHAGVLSAKLKHIGEWSDLRRKWAARYDAGPARASTSSSCPTRGRATATCTTCT